jgi:hypothetical protein
MIGVAADGPGNCVDHLTFFVFENSAGKLFSPLDPLKLGPRHCAQFSARAATVIITPLNMMETVLICWCSIAIAEARPKASNLRCTRIGSEGE